MLDGTLPSTGRIPIAEPKKWLQGGAELRGSVASLTESVLGKNTDAGGNGKPPTNDKPLFGFAADDFDGKRIKIDLSQVEVLKRKNGRAGLMIPVVFKDSGDQIWVGAQLTEDSAARRGEKTVEEIVLAALHQVESERRTPDREEAENGLIQINRRVGAFIGKDRAAIQQALMNSV